MFSPLPLLSLITTYPFEVATRPDSSVIWVSATVHTGWPRPGTGVPSPGTTGVGEGAYANAGAAPRKNASTPMNDTTTARRIGQVSQSRSSCGGPSPLPGRRDGRHRVRRQLGRQRLVHSRVHHGALRGVLARAHLAPGVHPRHQVTTLVRHPRPELHRRPGKPSLHLGPELGEPGAGAGRDEHRVGPQPLEAQQRLLLCRVDLVHDEQLGHRVRAHLGEHLTYRPDLLLRVGMRTVDHVQDQVGVGDLFQGRPERLDQLVRQVPDEPDGVRERVHPAFGRVGPAGCGVQGREQRVLDQDARTSEPVEQAGLAGVGVAGDRHAGHAVAAAGAALGLAYRAHAGDVALEAGDPGVDAPAIGLQLRLARAAQADPAALGADPATGLPTHRLAPTAQPRQQVLQLGQLDLRLALLALGVLGDYFLNQPAPTDNYTLSLHVEPIYARD